jgi:shikimate kinase
LSVVAEVKLLDEPIIEYEVKVRGAKSNVDDRLIKALVQVLKEEYHLTSGIKVAIDSNIPFGRGLKSSSVVANALSLAVDQEMNLHFSKLEAVKFGVKIAKKAGVTLTGAFDDACASMFGGVQVTDNSATKIIKSYDVEDKAIVILNPKYPRPKEGGSKETYQSLTNLMSVPITLALLMRWKDPVCDALNAGAEVAGLSGFGPAIVAVTDNPQNVIEAWKHYSDDIITSRTRRLEE